MLLQRRSRRWHDRGSMCLAAVQHSFPEAVFRARLNGTDPNRSFAASQLDVSHADPLHFRSERHDRHQRRYFRGDGGSRVQLRQCRRRPVPRACSWMSHRRRVLDQGLRVTHLYSPLDRSDAACLPHPKPYSR